MQQEPLLIYCAASSLLDSWAGLLKKSAASGRFA
jgi:hypothetical protein